MSILSVVSKILEKAIYIQLEAYLVKIILFMNTNLGSEVPSLQIFALFPCYIILKIKCQKSVHRYGTFIFAKDF